MHQRTISKKRLCTLLLFVISIVHLWFSRRQGGAVANSSNNSSKIASNTKNTNAQHRGGASNGRAHPTHESLLATYRKEIQAELLKFRGPQPCQLNRPWFHIRLNGSAWKGGRNFGDDLNIDLASALVGGASRSDIPVSTNRYQSGKIVAIGSVLTQVMPGDIVLGTGLAFASKDAVPSSPLWSQQLPNATIISVRGPDTRAAILKQGGSCPEVYGDLGVTASLLIWPDLTPADTPSHAVCVIPHATDATLKKEAAVSSSVHVLSISPPTPLVLAKQLMDCGFVISSSLHVLMIADAFGIPTRWYNGPDSNAPAKYLDYFNGIGVVDVTYATTLQQAIDMGRPMAPALTLDIMKSVTLQLIRTFPFDIVCKK